MSKHEVPTNFEIRQLRVIADFQFGSGSGTALFSDNIKIERSRATRRIRFIYLEGQRICSFRVRDGYLVPSLFGAKKLNEKGCGLKVTVHPDAEPFVRNGKSLFAKHVLEADEGIAIKEEVILVTKTGYFLGIGTAKLSTQLMKEMKRGVAVDVRKGIDQK